MAQRHRPAPVPEGDPSPPPGNTKQKGPTGTQENKKERKTGKNTVAVSAPHVVVYGEKGRFGGWPANHGIWSWGDEILVGFSAGPYKDLRDRHHLDPHR